MTPPKFTLYGAGPKIQHYPPEPRLRPGDVLLLNRPRALSPARVAVGILSTAAWLGMCLGHPKAGALTAIGLSGVALFRGLLPRQEGR